MSRLNTVLHTLPAPVAGAGLHYGGRNPARRNTKGCPIRTPPNVRLADLLARGHALDTVLDADTPPLRWMSVRKLGGWGRLPCPRHVRRPLVPAVDAVHASATGQSVRIFLFELRS